MKRPLQPVWGEQRSFVIPLLLSRHIIDGSHENFDMLDTLPTEKWNGGKIHRIHPSFLHLMRGQAYELDDRKYSLPYHQCLLHVQRLHPPDA